MNNTEAFRQIEFTNAEIEVLKLAKDKSRKEIAEILKLKPHTASVRLDGIFKKTSHIIKYSEYIDTKKFDVLQYFLQNYDLEFCQTKIKTGRKSNFELTKINERVKNAIKIKQEKKEMQQEHIKEVDYPNSNDAIKKLDEEIARCLALKDDLKQQLKYIEEVLTGLDYSRNILSNNKPCLKAFEDVPF